MRDLGTRDEREIRQNGGPDAGTGPKVGMSPVQNSLRAVMEICWVGEDKIKTGSTEAATQLAEL